MGNVSTNIKIDSELKKQAQELFNEMGLTLTSAVNLFLSQAVREKAIPFKIAMVDENGFTATEVAELKRRINDLEQNNGTVHDIIEVD